MVFPLGRILQRARRGLFATAAVIGLASGLAVAALGGELGGREGDAAEQLAGVLGAARRVAALLGGDAVVHDGYDELCVPFQTDDGELPQGHIEPSAVSLQHQVLIEHGFHPVRHLHRTVSPSALTGFPNPRAEHHGVQSLHHSRWAVGQVSGDGVCRAGAQVAAVDVGAAFFTAEDDPLGKDGQAAECCRAVGADDGIGQDAVVEGNVYAVMVPVEGHGLHIYVGA